MNITVNTKVTLKETENFIPSSKKISMIDAFEVGSGNLISPEEQTTIFE